MKHKYVLAAVLAVVLSAAPAAAQTTLLVPYGTAQFLWDAPLDPPSQGSGVTKFYLLNCGNGDVRIDLPDTSIPVRAVLSGPGRYVCTLKAANEFGESAAANFPVFETGYAPASPVEARIEVR